MMKGGAEVVLVIVALAAATGAVVLTNPAIVGDAWIPVTGEAVAVKPVPAAAPVPPQAVPAPEIDVPEPLPAEPTVPEPAPGESAGGGGGSSVAPGDAAGAPGEVIVVPEAPAPRLDLPRLPVLDPEEAAAFFAEMDRQAAVLSAAEAERRFEEGVSAFSGGVEKALKMEPAVLHKLGYIGPDGLVSVILRLDQRWPGETGERWLAYARAKARKEMERYGYSPEVQRLDVGGTRLAQMRVPLGSVDALARLPGVQQVVLDKRMRAELDDSVRIINATMAWNQTDGSGRFLFGNGVKIAVVDSGVDYTHADLGGCTATQFSGGTCAKVPKGYDFVNDDGNPMDDHGHGTHVAAIAAGNGTFKGVAPEATIYAYKVLDASGDGVESDIIAAIARALDPNSDGSTSDRVDIISLSLGGPGSPDDPVSQAVDRAVEAGAVVVVAAGNNGLRSPGMAQKALTVGSVSKSLAESTFSGRGITSIGQVKPEVRAVGENVCAARWGTNILGGTCRDSSHVSLSGTSMAAPQVSGVVALLKQKNGTWDALEYRQALRNLTTFGYFASSGGGISNASLVVSTTHPVPVALFNGIRGRYSTGAVLDTAVGISGYAYGDNFKNYTLEIKPAEFFEEKPYFSTVNGGDDVNPWTTIATGTSAVTNGTLMSSFNVSKFSQGMHFLRLTVWNTQGQHAKDYLVVNVSNVYFTAPRAEILRKGASLDVRGSVLAGNYTNYTVEIGAGFAPTNWSTSWLSQNTGSGFVENGSIAQLNLSALTAAAEATGNREWTLRVRARLWNGNETSAERSFVWDPTDGDWPREVGAAQSGVLLFPPIAQPTVADLDDDGRKEIVVAVRENVTVLFANGTVRWTRLIGKGSLGELNTLGPAVGDVVGDGKKEVVVGDESGKVWMFAHDGSNVSGWPRSAGSGRIGAVALGDVDGNGALDIVYASSGDGKVYVKDSGFNTASGWPQAVSGVAAGSIASAPSLADLNGDGRSEVLVGGSTELKLFWANGSVIWVKTLNSTTDLPAAIADVNNDGAMEMLVMERGAGRFHAYQRDGSELSGWPVNESGVSWPGVGDMDNDGLLDAVGGSAVVRANGGRMNITVPLGVGTSHAVVADVDFDGRDDLLQGSFDSQLCVGGAAVEHCKAVAYLADQSEGVRAVAGFPHYAAGSSVSAAVDDLDADGRLEYVYLSTRGEMLVWEVPGQVASGYRAAWPAFHGDAQRSGATSYSTAKRARFAGMQDGAEDLDGDGLHDRLVATFSVNVSESGSYKAVGWLYGPDGAVVAKSAENASSLSSGMREMAVAFPGAEVFSSGQAGNFSVRAQMWRTASGQDAIQHTWDRRDVGFYNSTGFERNARFNGTFGNGTVDEDGDGFADSLAVRIGVEVLAGSGTFTVRAKLESPSGAAVTAAENVSALGMGNHTVMLRFPGTDVFASKENGSFRVTDVTLLGNGEVLDWTGNPLNTSTYAWTQFQRPAKLGSGYADGKADTDGNGLAEALEVRVPLVVARNGTFTVRGELWDGSTKVNGSAVTTTLSVGQREAVLAFSGIAVFKNRRDAAFSVKNVEVVDGGGDLLGSAATPHTTASYEYLDFEKSVRLGSPTDAGVDNDSSADGHYNRLVVSVPVSGVESGAFTVSGDLHDTTGAKVQSASATVSLSGSATAELVFDGVGIYLNGKDGFTVRGLALVDGSGRDVDAAGTYATSVTGYAAFQRPARMAGFSGTGVDNDSDGYYNGLRVDVTVVVTRPGSYSVTAGLYDKNAHKVGEASGSGTLSAGAQKVLLMFNGVDIFENRVSGEWTVRDAVLKLDGVSVDAQSGTASLGNLDYGDCQPPVRVTGNYDDYGLNTDSNSKYDWLVFEVEVAVAKPGTYTFMGSLLDARDDRIVEWEENTTTLSAGAQKVLLMFVGEDIRLTGSTTRGFYELELLRTMDGQGREIERVPDAAVTERSYATTQFDSTTTSRRVVNCSETDSGLDYSTEGVSTGTKASGTEVAAADFCLPGGKLREYYCKTVDGKTSLRVKKAYTCENSCSAGACV